MLTSGKMEAFVILMVVYCSSNCGARSLDKSVTEEGMAFSDFNRLQINSLAYPDEDYPTTLSPAEDTTSASVENIGDLTTTVFYPPDEDDSLNVINKEMDNINNESAEDDDDDDDTDTVEDQQRVLIIVTQTTTAVMITFVSCFILICVLFCMMFLCVVMVKPPRQGNMTIAVPPSNNNLPVSKISCYSNSLTSSEQKLDCKY